MEDEYDSQIKDYRNIDLDDRTNNTINKPGKLSFHKERREINPDDVMMDFDATSLYLSAKNVKKSFYPEMEIGFALKLHTNDIYVEAFKNQTFNKHGDESTILKIKYYSPPDLIFQHLPVKENVKNIELNIMRKGYTADTLTSVVFQEIVKIGEKVIQFYEGVIYRETFRRSPFRTVV